MAHRAGMRDQRLGDHAEKSYTAALVEDAGCVEVPNEFDEAVNLGAAEAICAYAQHHDCLRDFRVSWGHSKLPQVSAMAVAFRDVLDQIAAVQEALMSDPAWVRRALGVVSASSKLARVDGQLPYSPKRCTEMVAVIAGWTALASIAELAPGATE